MQTLNPLEIAHQAQDAHDRTLALIQELNEEQMMGPMLATVNPLRWEIGHAAYFYEYWVLRYHLQQGSIREDSDSLYDSITIDHDDRWDLPLPTLPETQNYMQTVLDNIKVCLSAGDDAKRDYLAQYAVFHHDMHNEAYTYTRQTLNYPMPYAAKPEAQVNNAGGLIGDVRIPGGVFVLGATLQDGFVFDNEKWAHEVEIKPFTIAKAAICNADYLKFVEADGYHQKEYWDDDGWLWLQAAHLDHPIYWRKRKKDWEIKQFDQWNPMSMNAAIIHVCWFEAQAYCRWAGRRLPTEVEWEVAASAQASPDGKTLSSIKRHFPWGNQSPRADQANLDGFALGTVDVGAHATGDSAFGCRQMIGNVWEWTQDTFGPYPGFEADMYQDYSQPLFGITKVLRGGAWATRARMIRNTWRTYYGPERNDVFAGFRTCSLEE